jgi:hypothetical protein
MDAVFPPEEGEAAWIFSAGPFISYNPIFPAAKGNRPITMNVNLKGFWYPRYQSGKALVAAALHIPLPLSLEWSLLGSGGGVRSGEDRETLMTASMPWVQRNYDTPPWIRP